MRVFRNFLLPLVAVGSAFGSSLTANATTATWDNPLAFDDTIFMPPGSSPQDDTAKKAKLKLVSYASDGIEAVVPPATGANGLPEIMQGLWWLDGNPQKGSVLLSLEKATYNPETRTAQLPFFGVNTYSFIADCAGQADFDAGLQTSLIYKISFSEDFRSGRIQSQVDFGGKRYTSPVAISDFTFVAQGDGVLVRHSKVFGIPTPDYYMRRIVNARGEREPAYEDYLRATGRNSYVVEPLGD